MSKTPKDKCIGSDGYVYVLSHSHHRSDVNGYVREHVIMCEQALGKLIPNKYPIHHIDGDPKNNNNNNLVICESNAYHCLLHQRAEALRNSGSVYNKFCFRCKSWKNKSLFFKNKAKGDGLSTYCCDCTREYRNTNKEHLNRLRRLKCRL